MKRASASLMMLAMLCLLQVGAAAQPGWPAWSAPTADGLDFRSSSLTGKVVVVSVWASWCPSCRKQMPLLSQLQTSHQSDPLQVVSFSLDRTADEHEKFLGSHRVGFPAIFARNGRGLEAVKMLQEQAGALEAVPTLMVFDRSGRLVHRSVGFSSLNKLEGLVAPLLAP